MSDLPGFYRYVPHSRRAEYEENGWAWVCELSLPHGEWSCLMKWRGE